MFLYFSFSVTLKEHQAENSLGHRRLGFWIYLVSSSHMAYGSLLVWQHMLIPLLCNFTKVINIPIT